MMKTTLSTVILGAVLWIPVLALDTHADDMADAFFSTDTSTLSVQERRALAIAQRWQVGSAAGGQPFAGRGGAVQFVFGTQAPSVVCAVLQVCDITLQPSEQVNSIQLGDTARWSVEPAISQEGAADVQHLLIKPLDVGLRTSLVVTTDRRTYHIQLHSHRSEYMPQVVFVYPEEALAKWDTIRTHDKQQHEKDTIPVTGEYLGDLSFDYDVSGDASWKPVRVFNDGHKTVIQMPHAMQQTEAPTLLVIRKEGGLFTDPDTVTVNYRVQGDRYIVDSVFEKAILISGVGSSQDKVTIAQRKE